MKFYKLASDGQIIPGCPTMDGSMIFGTLRMCFDGENPPEVVEGRVLQGIITQVGSEFVVSAATDSSEICLVFADGLEFEEHRGRQSRSSGFFQTLMGCTQVVYSMRNGKTVEAVLQLDPAQSDMCSVALRAKNARLARFVIWATSAGVAITTYLEFSIWRDVQLYNAGKLTCELRNLKCWTVEISWDGNRLLLRLFDGITIYPGDNAAFVQLGDEDVHLRRIPVVLEESLPEMEILCSDVFFNGGNWVVVPRAKNLAVSDSGSLISIISRDKSVSCRHADRTKSANTPKKIGAGQSHSENHELWVVNPQSGLSIWQDQKFLGYLYLNQGRPVISWRKPIF